MRPGRRRASCAHDVLRSTWRRTASTTAAADADCKTNRGSGRLSADLRPAGRRMRPRDSGRLPSHSWRRGAGRVTRDAPTKTCYHLTRHSHNQQACQLLCRWRLGTQWGVCVCVCVPVSCMPDPLPLQCQLHSLQSGGRAWRRCPGLEPGRHPGRGAA